MARTTATTRPDITGLYTDANLKALYRLEDIYDSKSTNHLTNTGGVIFSAGKFLNGANLGTTNSTKRLSVESNLGVAGTVSMAFWVKLTTEITSGNYAFLSLGRSLTDVEYLVYYSYNSGTPQLRFLHNKFGSASTAGNYNITLGTSNWYHIVYTDTGSAQEGFVNGVSVANAVETGNGSSAVTDRFVIGDQGTGLGTLFASAIFDEVAIFDKILSQAEITALQTGTVNSNRTAATARTAYTTFTKYLLHFDGADGATSFTDEASHSVTALGNGQLDTAQYKFGTASLLCDGDGDGATLPTNADLAIGTQAFTIDWWVMIDIADAVNVMCSHAGSNVNFSVFYDSDNKLTLYSPSAEQIKAASGTTLDVWHHIAMVGNGGGAGARNIKLYQDGVQIGSTWTTNYNFAQDAFSIGYNLSSSAQCLFGWIDEFRISLGVQKWTVNFTPPTTAGSVSRSVIV